MNKVDCVIFVFCYHLGNENPFIRLTDWHIVEVEVTGPQIAGRNFTVKTTRNNPADPGAVTGSATYSSFLSSVVRAGGRGPGVHLC